MNAKDQQILAELNALPEELKNQLLLHIERKEIDKSIAD